VGVTVVHRVFECVHELSLTTMRAVH
jgi:hypothetical protein